MKGLGRFEEMAQSAVEMCERFEICPTPYPSCVGCDTCKVAGEQGWLYNKMLDAERLKMDEEGEEEDDEEDEGQGE